MGREAATVHQWTEEPKFRASKERTVIRCDDGYIYEFERLEDQPLPRLVRGFKPSGEMSHLSGSKILPAAVKETVDSLFTRWEK